MIDFCHIAPTPHLNLIKNRHTHLVLAHLIEEDEKYCEFYKNCGAELIMDNSAFEMYKRGLPMYPTDKLITMAKKVNATYVVMSDYPKEPITKTIIAAEEMMPQLKQAGLRAFFCPQAEPGNFEGLIASYGWGLTHPDIDYIAFSILNIPIAYNCESGNPTQKFISRWKFMKELDKRFGLKNIKKYHDKKFHFLGMSEGPNEIELMQEYHDIIDTWDSSAAIWAGLNGITFDRSPTGLHNGKFDKEVDFAYEYKDNEWMAEMNMQYIDNLCGSGCW
jgi:hypothetical protein